MPLISICIPAYKRATSLQRLLQSISIQSFDDFEVVVTDDSPDEELKFICGEYTSRFNLNYHKNPTALGTPENWNEAVRHARGEWIKIMHDDDWFSGSDSLQKLVNLAESANNADFIFCGSAIYEEGKLLKNFTISNGENQRLRRDPANLFAKNTIGPPSVIMYRKSAGIDFDKQMKWLVDVDFYIRYLQVKPVYVFTKEPLINVGFNPQQVTNQVIHDKKVVLPETFLLLNKIGTDILKRIRNYDFAWRLIRNYQVRSMDELETLNPLKNELARHFSLAIKWQKRLPISLLRLGLLSKILMFINYLFYRYSFRK